MKRKFEVSVYKSSRRFCIPKRERIELGIEGGDSVHLVIRTPSGTVLFRGRQELRSGPEIYGKDMKALEPGATIKVEASEPITAYRTPSEREADDVLMEGSRVAVRVNRFERNSKARALCIRLFGTACHVCGFDFEQCYGKIGKGFIHVHHLTPVSEISKRYVVDARKDLRPVCPNCHEMLHSRPKLPISIAELRAIIKSQREDQPPMMTKSTPPSISV